MRHLGTDRVLKHVLIGFAHHPAGAGLHRVVDLRPARRLRPAGDVRLRDRRPCRASVRSLGGLSSGWVVKRIGEVATCVLGLVVLVVGIAIMGAHPQHRRRLPQRRGVRDVAADAHGRLHDPGPAAQPAGDHGAGLHRDRGRDGDAAGGLAGPRFRTRGGADLPSDLRDHVRGHPARRRPHRLLAARPDPRRPAGRAAGGRHGARPWAGYGVAGVGGPAYARPSRCDRDDERTQR